MGAVKALTTATAEAGVMLGELLSNGISFVVAGDARMNGFAWYIAPEGNEYEQEDWVFHALRHGNSPTLAEAVSAVGEAVCEMYPYCDFAKARKPKRRLKALT